MKKSLINTLIVHNGSLGDLILSLPAIRCIREASELLHIAGKEGAVELLKQLNHADQVSSAGSAMFLSLYNNLPDKDAREFLGQFSRAYVFSKNRTPIVAESLRKIIPEVYIILTEPSGISLHVSDYQLQQLKGCAAEERAQFIQNVPIPLRQRAASVLAVNGITVGQKPFITMHPGSGGREKNWPSERFAELAGRIISHHDVSVVILFGPAEEYWRSELGLKYYGEKHERVRTFLNPDLMLVTGILSLSVVYIGNDSGITHLASAVNRNTVAVYGPTDALLWAPVGGKTKVIVSGRKCIPCGERRKQCLSRDCLADIRTETVYHEVANLLSQSVLSGC